ncbi:MAG: hypothetical protein ABWK05_02800 [Pyrobaculum sp.]
MIERELVQWMQVARRSGKRGWVLVKNGEVVGVFNDRKEAIMSAREPGVYLLTFVE